MYRQLIVNYTSIQNESTNLVEKKRKPTIADDVIFEEGISIRNKKDGIENVDQSENDSVSSEENDSQYIFLLNEAEIKNESMKEIDIKKDISVIVIKQKDNFYVLASKCANCNSPLIQGALLKYRLYCVPYGTCYDIRTGYLDGYPGIYSQNTFKTIVKNGKVFIITKPEMLTVNRRERPMVKYTFQLINNPTIIVGSGISALTCAEVLRQNGYKDQIIILTKDNTLPIYRYLLSKNPDINDENLLIRDKTFYENYGIDIRLNTKVTKVDVTDKVVYSDDGRSLTYSNLVIATGTALKQIVIPGSTLGNVLYFKNPNDGKLIFENAKKKHISFYNCTPHTITLSTTLIKTAKTVTIYCKENSLFKQGGKEFNEELINYLENVCDVSVRLNNPIRCIEGEGKVKHLVLSNGICAVSNMVIPSNGEMACSSFMLGSKMKITPNHYIEVDENMKTNIPNIYAIGDCSYNNSKKYNNKVYVNSWQYSQVEGKICALNILNKKVDINSEIPFFWFHVGDEIVVYVHTIENIDNDTISRGSFETKDFITYFFDNDIVVGVICFGNVTPAIQIFECLKRNINITKMEVEVMTENFWNYKLI
uniref:Rieske domain-containing protein n=1 Tax=Strongyloides papillosus TaxID=174720 RepID=A0A0N5BLH7_STREA